MITKKQKKINAKERHMKTKAYAKKQLKKNEKQKDNEWRQKVIEQYGARCAICKNIKKPNAHHIIPRTFKETRWDPENGIMLCPRHHKFGKFSAHKNPLWFITLLIKNEPKKYKYLITKLAEIIKK